MIRKLLDELGARLGVAIHELLEGGEFAHLTFRDDVVFDARGHTVNHLGAGLGGQSSRRHASGGDVPRAQRPRAAQRQEGTNRGEDRGRAPHQNTGPILKKNWKCGSRKLCGKFVAGSMA